LTSAAFPFLSAGNPAGNPVWSQVERAVVGVDLPSPVGGGCLTLPFSLLGVGFRAEGEVVVERLSDVAEFERRRGAIGPAGRAFPEVEMAEDFLDGRIYQKNKQTVRLDSKPVGHPLRLSTFTPPATTADFYTATFSPHFDRRSHKMRTAGLIPLHHPPTRTLPGYSPRFSLSPAEAD
jgi:hypothetical protein